CRPTSPPDCPGPPRPAVLAPAPEPTRPVAEAVPKVPRTTPCVCNGRPAAARKMPGMRPRRLRTDPEPRRRSRRRGLVAFEGGPRVTLKKNPRNTGARRTDGARVLAAALALGALAGCSGEAAPEAMPPPPQVSAAPVLVREVAHWDEFIG